MAIVRFITLYKRQSVKITLMENFDDAMVACLSGFRLRLKLIIVNIRLVRVDDEQEKEG
jgi:hypothetical protein